MYVTMRLDLTAAMDKLGESDVTWWPVASVAVEWDAILPSIAPSVEAMAPGFTVKIARNTIAVFKSTAIPLWGARTSFREP